MTHKSIYYAYVKYLFFFFGNTGQFFPLLHWIELWGKVPAKILCLSIVSGIKEPVRIK